MRVKINRIVYFLPQGSDDESDTEKEANSKVPLSPQVIYVEGVGNGLGKFL